MDNALIITLALICVIVPFWIAQRYGVVRLFSPLHMLSYFAGFGFLVKVVAFPTNPELAFYARYITIPGALFTGAAYLGLFILAICLGYLLAVRPFDRGASVREARFVAAGTQGTGRLIAVAYAVVALTVVLLLQARGLSGLSWDVIAQMNQDKQIAVNGAGVGSTMAGLKTLFVVPKAVFVLILAKGLVLRDMRLMAHAAGLAAVLVFVAMVSGDRFELVELLAYGAATYLILGGALRLRALLGAGVAAALVLALSAHMTHLRGNDAGMLDQLIGSTYFLDINAAVMVTDRVGPAQLFWGETYTWWSFGWVPRALWPEKPAIDLGVFLKRDVMGIATGGAFNVTGPGEAYMNFGWAGLGVGVVLGWVFRKVEVWVLHPTNTLRHASFFIYPLIVYPFVQATLQSSFSAFIVGAAAQMILIGLILRLSVPRYRVRSLHQMDRQGRGYA